MGSRHFCEYSFPEQVSQTDFLLGISVSNGICGSFLSSKFKIFFCFKTKCRARNQKAPCAYIYFFLLLLFVATIKKHNQRRTEIIKLEATIIRQKSMHRLGIINVKKFCSIPILWLWCYAIICCDEVNFRIYF